MSVAIPSRAAERNGRRGDHRKPKDPHHPHHAYRVVWMDGMKKTYIAREKGRMSSQRHTSVKTLTIATTHTNWLPNQCD